MKLNEQIGAVINEIVKARYPEDKDAYKKICEHVIELKGTIQTLYNIAQTLKEIDNIQTMMYWYLPKDLFFDRYGSRSIADNERCYINLAREKKKLIKVLFKLKAELEGLKDD